MYEMITIFLIILDGMIDGAQDTIDHGKGALPLNHIWHLLKSINRLVLIAIGFMFSSVYGFFIFRCFVDPELKLALFFILVIVLGIAKLGWYFVRDNFKDKLIYLDNHFDLSFGWKLFDRFIGFDKEIDEPIFKWPWRK